MSNLGIRESIFKKDILKEVETWVFRNIKKNYLDLLN